MELPEPRESSLLLHFEQLQLLLDLLAILLVELILQLGFQVQHFPYELLRCLLQLRDLLHRRVRFLDPFHDNR